MCAFSTAPTAPQPPPSTTFSPNRVFVRGSSRRCMCLCTFGAFIGISSHVFRPRALTGGLRGVARKARSHSNYNWDSIYRKGPDRIAVNVCMCGCISANYATSWPNGRRAQCVIMKYKHDGVHGLMSLSCNRTDGGCMCVCVFFTIASNAHQNVIRPSACAEFIKHTARTHKAIADVPAERHALHTERVYCGCFIPLKSLPPNVCVAV